MIPPYYISLFLVPMTFTLVQCIKCCLYRARTTISLLFNFTRSVLESIPMTSINAHLIVKERITCLQFTNQSSLIHMLNSVRVRNGYREGSGWVAPIPTPPRLLKTIPIPVSFKKLNGAGMGIPCTCPTPPRLVFFNIHHWESY